jgi:hypothetical protein
MNSVNNGGQLIGNCVYCGCQLYSGMVHYCPTVISSLHTQTEVVPVAPQPVQQEGERVERREAAVRKFIALGVSAHDSRDIIEEAQGRGRT